MTIKFNGSTHRGESRRSCGGVGRNLAGALMNLGITGTKFLSVIGDDDAGKEIVHSLGYAASTVLIRPDISSARYTAVVDNKGNCCFGIGEFEAFSKIDDQYLKQHANILKNTPLLVLDGNLSLDALKCALDFADKNHVPVWYEPTDLRKALKIFQCGAPWQKVLNFISPNINELLAMAEHFNILIPEKSEVNLQIIKEVSERLAERIPVVIATVGAQGVLVCRKASTDKPFFNEYNDLIETSGIQSHLYRTLYSDKEIVNVSGCGDCLAAGIITGILRGWAESNCIILGLHAAKQSLISFETVPRTIKLLPALETYYNADYHKLCKIL